MEELAAKLRVCCLPILHSEGKFNSCFHWFLLEPLKGFSLEFAVIFSGMFHFFWQAYRTCIHKQMQTTGTQSKVDEYFVLWGVFKAFSVPHFWQGEFPFITLWFAVTLSGAANLAPESHKQVGDILDLSILSDYLYHSDHCCVRKPWPYAWDGCVCVQDRMLLKYDLEEERGRNTDVLCQAI